MAAGDNSEDFAQDVTSDLSPPAMFALLAYRFGEILGAEAPLVQALKQAAETARPEDAAQAWQQMQDLPADLRQAAAHWLYHFTKAQKEIAAQSDGDKIVPFPLHKT